MKKLYKKSKKKIIKYLSIDPVFNIYNRIYMDYIINEKKLKYIYILDFNGISNKNKEIGFDKVNEKFKKIFSKKFKKIYIGRFFSGDEIIIATNKKNIKKQIKYIENISKSLDMSFEIVYFKNNFKTLMNIMIQKIKKFE